MLAQLDGTTVEVERTIRFVLAGGLIALSLYGLLRGVRWAYTEIRWWRCRRRLLRQLRRTITIRRDGG